ncbi:4Fe-4S single cluster protein [Anaerobacterium chartisolvens]|uniref:4Fe-4S single cluster protein n=1 Tax=Anaerobacterium chartisolvens TaxID=1297424 RepID=A0A369AL63_9FIRM|nr:DUF512 domain-containing protein [Anaerobacterium chartisolvens]RCX09068.1 4Fe-4S single cluster protein [Anaerobacterium chartisolvens]
MKTATKDYIINTIFRTNILPVISECNTSCIFCSHKQNPREVEVFRIPKLKLQDFYELADFISPDRKIVIGESATRLIEGEPLLHKEFEGIISMIRNRFSHTPIQITTNGILLDDGIIDSLARLGNIELNISVNSVDAAKRMLIFGLKSENNIEQKLRLLKGRIRFSGSFVVLPEILDENDIENIIASMERNGAETVRAFLPGYTSMTNDSANFNDAFTHCAGIIKALEGKYSIPVILEPSLIGDLNCRVEGVINKTPAHYAGIEKNDVILSVNESVIKTRVEGFDKIYRLAKPVLKVAREEGRVIEIKLDKPKNSPPGFVVLYDVSAEAVKDVNTVVRRNNTKRLLEGKEEIKKVLFMTSVLAAGILRDLFKKTVFPFSYEILSVKNNFFGGNIVCAGLLTAQDVILTAREYLKANGQPDLIILPPIMFDFTKRDLLGKGIDEIENELKIAADTP